MATDDLEHVLDLFDSYWFEYQIFASKPASSIPQQNPLLQIHEEALEDQSNLSRIQTDLHMSDHDDQCFSSKDSFSSDSLSPNSVLLTPKLESILSGQDIGEFSELPVGKAVITVDPRKRRRKGGNSSKSLSDLEFEELKGFMDLGFVFSEEDRESSLVSIIPGLQRLGRKVGDEDDGDGDGDGDGKGIDDETVVSRPYLSEAWDEMEDMDDEKPMMNWMIPHLSNEMDMKDHLRFWAQTVASTIRS